MGGVTGVAFIVMAMECCGTVPSGHNNVSCGYGGGGREREGGQK